MPRASLLDLEHAGSSDLGSWLVIALLSSGATLLLGIMSMMTIPLATAPGSGAAPLVA
jgi:hypothetical protein